MRDEFHGVGGSYELRDGKRVRVQEPTRHSIGGGARDQEGKPLPGTVPPQESPAAEAAPKARRANAAAASGD